MDSLHLRVLGIATSLRKHQFAEEYLVFILMLVCNLLPLNDFLLRMDTVWLDHAKDKLVWSVYEVLMIIVRRWSKEFLSLQLCELLNRLRLRCYQLVLVSSPGASLKVIVGVILLDDCAANFCARVSRVVFPVAVAILKRERCINRDRNQMLVLTVIHLMKQGLLRLGRALMHGSILLLELGRILVLTFSLRLLFDQAGSGRPMV